eukprot:TRINITY_DN4130_c0_g1_i1.p1 TRINITY_DN4130_c0_g1~~TRINITY_DN4130_c0_g1_i1.p1  ORF type:complete len:291 (+),score=40.27 TRINITY_DN4130_c0_g1_i1:55-927(+)
MLPSVTHYVNLLTQEESVRKKEEEAYYTFSFYDTQRSMYRYTPMKFSPPSIDFGVQQLPNSKTKYPYPFPVNLTHRKHEDKDEHEKSLYADQITEFLNPFLDNLVVNKQFTGKESLFQHVLKRFELYSLERPGETLNLKRLLGVDKLLIPFMEIHLPGDFLLAYNELDSEDPQVLFYQQHDLIAPEIQKLGVFLNHYDTNKEVICHFLWSTVDSLLIMLPAVLLPPYPLCWRCQNSFATKVCGGCKIAKYCSKDCQAQDWKIPTGTPKTCHGLLCTELAELCKKHSVLTI